jgi:UDP-glucose 4-epimerase
MRVAVTGGAGFLGQRLGRMLEDEGVSTTLLDIRPSSDGLPIRLVDILDAEALRRVIRGHQVVVHAAALHGIHLRTATEADFMRVNGVGTANVLEAAVACGVGRVVFISSTSVYGIDKNDPDAPVAFVNEDTALAPRDLNDLCKVTGESLCTLFRHRYGLAAVAIRCGRFFPDNWLAFNLRKLAGGVDVEDVAQAVHLAAVARDVPSAVYCIAAGTRFGRDDAARLKCSCCEVIEERYPGISRLLEAHGAAVPTVIDRIVDISRARAELGYEPSGTVEAFLEELRETVSDTEGAALAEARETNAIEPALTMN